jgi:hypothetical protein
MMTTPVMELLAQNRHWVLPIVLLLGGLLVWVIGSIFVGWVARQKNRSGFGWFINGLIFSPLLAMIALAAVPALESREDVDHRNWEDETARIRRSGRRTREGP